MINALAGVVLGISATVLYYRWDTATWWARWTWHRLRGHHR